MEAKFNMEISQRMSTKSDRKSTPQKTLKNSIAFFGIGLHTGNRVSMQIRAGETGSGIYFLRTDVPKEMGVIPARWNIVTNTTMGITITNEHGISVSAISHVMAALYGCGVDNAEIELDGPEVPSLDGSAEPFVAMIQRIGTVSQPIQRRAIYIHQPIVVGMNDQFAVISPNNDPRITVEINHPLSVLGHKKLSLSLTEDVIQREIAPARTFNFAKHIKRLQKQGLAQGLSTRNTVVMEGNDIINTEKLRFNDEFVRHKMLDCIGDMNLAGSPIVGHFYSYMPDHTLNHALLCKLFVETDAWFYVNMDDVNDLRRLNSTIVIC